jgi:hypothetical protein
MRQGAGEILGNMEKKIAPLRNVQQLHSAADTHHRHPSLRNQLHQRAVEIFPARVEQSHGRMGHVSVDSRIQIGAATQDHAVQMF